MSDTPLTPLTTDEIAQLAAAVLISGMAVSMVDMGIVSSAIEAAAMGQEIATASERYPDNPIIQSLFSAAAVKRAKDDATFRIQLTPEEVKPEVIVETAIAHIQRALGILQAKASPDHIQDYKEFLYACAEQVAKAAGSGLFGTGSQKVSDAEAAALAQLKAALNP